MTKAISDQINLIRLAIERYLNLLDRDPADGESGLRNLALALDHLVSVYFETHHVEPAGDEEAPSRSYAEFYQRAGKAFPELGLYPYADPGEEKPLVADAIDDIADIAGDLAEVLWHFDNTSVANGVWEYRFGYQHHWGDHLHSLRNYLHSTRVAAW
jgi:hypothetical protein